MKLLYYNAYILPIFDYCCHIWGKNNQSYVKKVSALQNRAARIILRKPKRSPSNGLIENLKWLCFNDRCKYHCATLVYKILNGLAPCYLKDLITIANNNRYSLRSATKQDLVLNGAPRTSYYKQSFSYYGMTIWNEIPIDIRNSKSLQSFKIRYKSHLSKGSSLRK